LEEVKVRLGERGVDQPDLHCMSRDQQQHLPPPYLPSTQCLRTNIHILLQKIENMIKSRIKMDARHTDVLRNVLLDDLPPFHPGFSCGVTLCIEIQTQETQRFPFGDILMLFFNS